MKKLLLALALIFAMIIPAMATDDIRLSNVYKASYKMNDKFDIYLEPNMLFREDVTHLNSYYVRSGVVYHASKYLDLGIAELNYRVRNLADKWSTENRAEFDIIPKAKIGNFILFNRSKIAYRWLDVIKNRWQYRNLSMILYPIETFTLYIAEESFYCFEKKKRDLNLITFGVDKKISSNLTVGLFFTNETVRKGITSEWDTNAVIGTKINLSF